MTLYIGQQHPITVYRAVFVCALFWGWMSFGAPLTISLIEFYFVMIFIMIVVTIIGIFMAINYFLNNLNNTLGFLYRSSSNSANAQLPGCFRPWTFSLNIRLSMLPLDSFMSCYSSLFMNNILLCTYHKRDQDTHHIACVRALPSFRSYVYHDISCIVTVKMERHYKPYAFYLIIIWVSHIEPS